MTTFNKTLLILLLPLMGVSHAALIYDEDFSGFTTGNIDGQSSWDVSGASTTAYQIETGGLSYTNGDVNHSGGGQNVKANTGGNELAAFVNFGSRSDDELYFSFLFDQNENFFLVGLTEGSITGGGATPAGGAARFRGGSDESRGRLLDSSSNSEFGGSVTTSGQTILYVGRISKSTPGAANNYDDMSFLVNPSSLDEGSQTWTDIGSPFDTGLSSLDTFYFRGPNENADHGIDMLRVGTTFDDVVIPEPSTLALVSLFLGAAMVVQMRQRR